MVRPAQQKAIRTWSGALRSPGFGVRLLLLALAFMLLAACSETAEPDPLAACDDFLTEGLWDEAIDPDTGCPDDGGQGTSFLAQAHMGRAGISLLGLLDGLEGTTLQGEALILNVFTLAVGSAQYQDAETAVSLMLTIVEPTTTDNFNLIIASDVLLMSLFKARLAVTVDAATGIIVPGVTDTGIETLSDTSTTEDIQTILDNIYTNNILGSGSYYTTVPLVWEDSTADVDLSRITDFVAANKAGADGLGLTTDPDLASLAPLAFFSNIDNGTCGLSSGQTASGADNASDGPLVALNFPRRLNTSDDLADNALTPQIEPELLTDDLNFVLHTNGVADTGKEWGGAFLLPSALVNPDFVQTNCSDGTTFTAGDDGDFTDCMTGEKFVAAFAVQTDETVPVPICALGACTHWPVLGIDGDVTTDDATTSATAAATAELARVLHQLAPIKNSVTAPTGELPAYACAAADGIVHYREYDAYLRNFGVE